MSKRILWIDNDKIYLKPFKTRLKTKGMTLETAKTLTEGEKKVRNNNYDLLILDVMIPVKEEEEEDYPIQVTSNGQKSGFIFYKRMKEILEEKDINVLVFTIREDAEIRQLFEDVGLPETQYMTKSEGADASVFMEKVKEILESS